MSAAVASIVMERSAVDGGVLDMIMGYCAPVGNKHLKWPTTFKVAISSSRIKFTTTEDKLLLRMTNEDHGFAATKSYLQALAKIQELKGVIGAADLLLSLATPKDLNTTLAAARIVLAQ